MTKYENVGVHIEIPEIEVEGDLDLEMESAKLVLNDQEIYHLEPIVEYKEVVE